MPAKSKAQANLMRAAEHGADFPMARKLRQSMTHEQLHDFAVGSEKGKPEHVSHGGMRHGGLTEGGKNRPGRKPGMRHGG